MYEQDQNLEEEQFVIPPQPTHQFNLQNQASTKLKCKTLCIGFYGISSLYTLSLIDNKQIKPQNRINFQRAKQKALASIYQNNEICYLIFHDQFEKMKQIHLSKFIQENFLFQQIILFTSKAKGLLQNQINQQIAYIATSKFEEKSGIAKYPQGITGPEADLIQWGEINGVAVICYVGIYSQYQVKRQNLTQIYGGVSGRYGLESKYDITSEIKKYNMKKYANKLYL